MKPTEIMHQIRDAAQRMMTWAALLSEAQKPDRERYLERLKLANTDLRDSLEQLQEAVNG